MLLSWLYALYGNLGAIEALFLGLRLPFLRSSSPPCAGSAARRFGTLRCGRLPPGAFIAIFFLSVPFPIIILVAAVVGYLGGRSGLKTFEGSGGHGSLGGTPLADRDTALGEHIPDHARPSLGWSLRISTVFLVLWLAPVAALLMIVPDSVYTEIATFFSKMAVVTFGGAYAVLAYVAQEAVENYGWLHPGEMLDGLGMAETTPGPLIMVVQFVGFMGAAREAGGLDPLLAGTLAAILTTWVTFIPCFLWIFLGAPFAERIRGNVALSSTMTAITAAVVGVILNLAVWFALHTIFAEVVEFKAAPFAFDVPVVSSISWPALLLTVEAIAAMFRFKSGALTVICGCAVAGLFLGLIPL